MSRYDQPSEPDPDKYETRTEDIDVPDFDAPEPAVDPVEVIAHGLLTAIHAMELEVVKASDTDLKRATFLKKLTRQAFNAMDRADALASVKIDQILERRR